MPREILPPYQPDTFPENECLPEGVRTVRWTDTFGYGVALICRGKRKS